MKEYIELLREICNDLKINMKLLSKDYVIMLEKEGKRKFITGYKFSNNDHALGNVLDDKYATYDVLKYLNMPVCEHKIFYRKNNTNNYANGCNSFEDVQNYFNDNNNKVVVKPNDSTCGNDVYRINTIEELKEKVDKLFINNFSISICPYYDIKTEYRLIVVDGKIEVIYGKVKPQVIGNGKNSIRELLKEFNAQYFGNNTELDKSIYDKILKENEIYEYNWKFNLSRGANIQKEIQEEIKLKLLKLANKVIKELDLKFCSIDIVQTENNEFMILEINSGIMMKNFIKLYPNGKSIAKNIYTKAIKNIFK